MTSNWKQNVCTACRLRQFPVMAFSTQTADELRVKAETRWRAVNMHLIYVLYWETICSSSLLWPLDISMKREVEFGWSPPKTQEILLGKSMTEPVRRKNKGCVSAVSAGEKCFSTRPLTIIKVQHEATARVVQPWVSPCDWLKRDGDKWLLMTLTLSPPASRLF